MNTPQTQQTKRTFRVIALLGGLFLVIGVILRLSGLLITATFAMALAGGVGLLLGLIGMATAQRMKPK
ncbi:hypothetical protein GO730_14750 [Spirosoma sp. HMF3257]|uniref:Uncharacterized protein n=1 Tax=Spirosoma telluris TaxID=2183553 RepID=A0A327NK15_9BACT|nr:hypothetical protein [Spirosoma telluris]RAI75133.1 hypothetical protein HMF3257_14690 [Spirosoma telluris]